MATVGGAACFEQPPKSSDAIETLFRTILVGGIGLLGSSPKREHPHVARGGTKRNALGFDFDDLVSANFILYKQRLAID